MSQWLFPISALSCTPTAQDKSLHEEMYDRCRGIEFLYRLGTSIGLCVKLQGASPLCHVNPCLSLSHAPGLFTAATWFHRFFMRFSMLDYHRQVSRAAFFPTYNQYVIRPSQPRAYSLPQRQKSAEGSSGT